MQTVLRARFETAAAEPAFKTSSFARSIRALRRREAKPEVAYFIVETGARAGVFFFDMMESIITPAPLDDRLMTPRAAPALIRDEARAGLAPA